jgi:hypothetical protein
MTARIPAAAAPKAVATAALPVEAVVIVPTLFDVLGLRVSSLIHRFGVPYARRRAGAASSGVPPIGTG